MIRVGKAGAHTLVCVGEGLAVKGSVLHFSAVQKARQGHSSVNFNLFIMFSYLFPQGVMRNTITIIKKNNQVVEHLDKPDVLITAGCCINLRPSQRLSAARVCVTMHLPHQTAYHFAENHKTNHPKK